MKRQDERYDNLETIINHLAEVVIYGQESNHPLPDSKSMENGKGTGEANYINLTQNPTVEEDTWGQMGVNQGGCSNWTFSQPPIYFPTTYEDPPINQF